MGVKEDKILLGHGDGGLLTHELIHDLFLRCFQDEALDGLYDAAAVSLPAGRIAFSTDSFVVTPLFFPGGDIGKLAVCGTVNDLTVSGAVPLYLSASFILEEGLEISQLEGIVASMAAAARTAGVRIVTGDTKVVERGSADGLYINTAGIGVLPAGVQLGYGRVEPGDVVIINGSIGEHGIAVLSRRPGISFATPVQSDCAALNHLLGELLQTFSTVKIMRDPTRGGLATTVKELAQGCRLDICLAEEQIPLHVEVAGAAEMLGLDPLYLANEGKVVIIASPREGKEIVAFLRSHPLGREAGMIGEVRGGRGDVYLKTVLGGTRPLDMLVGAQLPRIC